VLEIPSQDSICRSRSEPWHYDQCWPKRDGWNQL